MVPKITGFDTRKGAEINSLEKMFAKYPGGDNEIVLMGSNNEDGKKAMNIVKYYFEMKNIKIETREIESLDHTLGIELFKKGLTKLVRDVGEIYKKCRAENIEVAINATGGYKAQTSFVGLVGQMLKVDVYYMFEEFSDVMKLPAIPIDFDLKLIRKHQSLLYEIRKDPEANTIAEIKKEREDEAIIGLFEELDNHYWLSPMLEMALVILESESGKVLEKVLLCEDPKLPTIEEISRTLNFSIKHEDGNANKVRGLDNFFKKIAKTGYVKVIKSTAMQPQIKQPFLLKPGNNEKEINGVFNANDRGIKFNIFTTANNKLERDCILNYFLTSCNFC